RFRFQAAVGIFQMDAIAEFKRLRQCEEYFPGCAELDDCALAERLRPGRSDPHPDSYRCRFRKEFGQSPDNRRIGDAGWCDPMLRHFGPRYPKNEPLTCAVSGKQLRPRPSPRTVKGAPQTPKVVGHVLACIGLRAIGLPGTPRALRSLPFRSQVILRQVSQFRRSSTGALETGAFLGHDLQCCNA